MTDFSPSSLTFASFVVLSAAVALADIGLVWTAERRKNGRSRAMRVTLGAMAVIVAWLALHLGIAESGILEGTSFPPPVMPYLLITLLVGIAVVASSYGKTIATSAPLAALVGIQAFRVPLEVLLHHMYTEGVLPVQMTWSGYNWDILTGIGAFGIGLLALRRPVPRWLLWVWNIAGSLLLINVVTIALLSAPLPIRQFHDGPPVVLVYHAPYNWIVSLHVLTALVGHLLIFRRLWGREALGSEDLKRQE